MRARSFWRFLYVVCGRAIEISCCLGSPDISRRALKFSKCLPTRGTALARSTAAAAIRLRTGLVHIERAPAKIGAVQCVDSLIRFVAVGHFDERKSSWLSRVAIRNDVDAFHRAVRFEEGANRLLRRSKIQITYKDVFQRPSLLAGTAFESELTGQKRVRPDYAGQSNATSL